jgi:Holliday junction resolvase-like predicted endonuclease
MGNGMPNPNFSVKDRGTGSRLTGARGKVIPEVYVHSGYKAWFLEFKTWMFRGEVAKYLFVSGVVPPEFTVAPTRSGDGEPSLRWTVTWTGSLSDHSSKLTSVGQDLRMRVVQGGDLTPDEAASEQAFRQAENARRIEQNTTYLRSLGMTAGEALKKMSPGAYVAAPGAGIFRLLPVAPNEKFPTDTGWLRKFVNGGYFVWIGKAGDSMTMEMTPVSTNTAFQRDVSWYLRNGDSLYEAEAKFTKQWDEISMRVLSTFALLLTTAPGVGGRADLGESAFGAAARDADRMIGREVRPEKPFNSMLSHVSPLEAVQTALVVEQVREIWQSLLERGSVTDDEKAELQSISNSMTTNLQNHMAGLPQKQIEKNLRTGQLGEAIIRKTLELRGYQVVELQNASGQGIDLVAIKVRGGSKGLIVYLEVKASVKDYPGRLSVAQKETAAFARDRLERVVAHEGLYQNVEQRAVDIAKLLIAEIDNGRPIGGIRADVHWLSKGLSFTVEFSHWKSPNIPRARVVPAEERAGSVAEPPEGLHPR